MIQLWRCNRHVILALAILAVVISPRPAQEVQSTEHVNSSVSAPSSMACDSQGDGLNCISPAPSIVPSSTANLSELPNTAVPETIQNAQGQSSVFPSDGFMQFSPHDDRLPHIHPTFVSTAFLDIAMSTSAIFGDSTTSPIPEVSPTSGRFSTDVQTDESKPFQSTQHRSEFTEPTKLLSSEQVENTAIPEDYIHPTLIRTFPTPVSSFIVSSSVETSPEFPSSRVVLDSSTPTESTTPTIPGTTIPFASTVVTPDNIPETKDYLVIVTVGKDCPEKRDVSFAFDSIAKNLPGMRQVMSTNVSCTHELNITMAVSVATGQAAAFIREVGRWEKGNRTMQLADTVFRVVRAHVYPKVVNNNITDSTDSKRFIALMTTEMIMYIAVGGSFGVVLFITLIICCVKCCRRKPSKMLEMEAIPHISFCPDDYTLTRIPRPNTICLDYYRGGSLLSDHFASNSSAPPPVEQRIVQAFDTSIVPLEDTRPPNPRPPGAGGQVVVSPRRMKTFNGKMGRDGSFVDDPSFSDSTERLHRGSSHEGNGVDNISFTKY